MLSPTSPPPNPFPYLESRTAHTGRAKNNSPDPAFFSSSSSYRCCRGAVVVGAAAVRTDSDTIALPPIKAFLEHPVQPRDFQHRERQGPFLKDRIATRRALHSTPCIGEKGLKWEQSYHFSDVLKTTIRRRVYVGFMYVYYGSDLL